MVFTREIRRLPRPNMTVRCLYLLALFSVLMRRYYNGGITMINRIVCCMPGPEYTGNKNITARVTVSDERVMTFTFGADERIRDVMSLVPMLVRDELRREEREARKQEAEGIAICS
jgi:hypothetical protein